MNRKCWKYVLLLTFAITGAGCREDLKDPDKEVKYKGPVIENKDVFTLYSDSAKLMIRMKAPVQQEFEGGDGVFPKGFYVEFMQQEGQVTSTMRANYGHQDKGKEIYFAKGDVQVHNILKQEKLETEELYWDRRRRKIYTDKFVKITTPNRVVTGHGLRSDQNFENYTIQKITGVFDLEE
ncbi:LPS export ABC transporter periplasmic protein LptC [Pontibacter sp. Tf4]|uniref:LPS export ABC transporter periplasmic protein LptC n=1 Tax=Pontibacter sp. Tf4 TaxID=2761620 RepID=UPI001626EC1E|nr:LPS export ABC transporter periplasmic protein LptC [Pontibacter sp. Tf4]MBB6609538.1 LPS export ABC transporter periplasmic protein LptC [Pontibacter sp. Tf4]